MIVVVAITIRGNRISSPLVISDLFPKRSDSHGIPETQVPGVRENGYQNNYVSDNNDPKEGLAEGSSESADHLLLEKQVQLSKWKVCEIVKVCTPGWENQHDECAVLLR